MFWRFDELFSKKLQKPPHFMKKHENSSIWPKLCNFFEQSTMFWCLDELFSKRLQKAAHFVKKHEKPSIWPKLASFGANYHVLAFSWTFQQEVAKSASFREKAREIIDLAKTMQLFEQTTMFLHFDELLRKKLGKVVHFVKKHEKSWIWSKLATFWKHYHVLTFRWTFQQKVAKTASFHEKARKLIDLAKTMQLLRTKYHVLVFGWTFQQKVAKSGSFREKARKNIDLAKTLQLFEQTTMSLHFDELFRKKLQKGPHFVKKHEKSSIWPKLCNFSNKLPCLCISMNFSGKSCKKCSFREKARKTIDLAKTCIFGANYHVLAFSWTFQQEVAKSASFREKAREIIDLAKTMQLFEQTTMFLHFDELLRKRLGKVVHFVKKHEKSWIWSKLATFWKHYHVLTFRWTFQQKVAKTASFREKARKIIDLAKTLQLFEQTTMSLHFDELFRKKLQKVRHFVKKHEKPSIWPKLASFGANYHVLAFSWTFQQEVAKSASFREKAREITIWNQLLAQLFGQTTMFLHFDELLRKRLGKVVHFVKKHEKSWIWSKLATFWKHYHVLTFRWTFQQKVARSGSIREKARKIIDLAKTLQLFEQTTMSLHFDELFRKKLQKVRHFVKKHEKPSIWPKLASFGANYHVLAFSWTFQQEVAKSASFREKAREIIDLAKTMQLFEQTTMFLHFDELLRKKLGKVVHFVKKHEKSWIWSKLATFWKHYHVLTFRWTFQQKVAKTASFHEKARKLIDLAKTMQLLRTKYHVLVHLDELFRKKLQKVAHFVKKHEKPSIWPKLASFGANYHVLAFSWTFQQEVAKSASFREKAREIIDLAKTMQLFEQTTMFLHFDELLRKKLGKVVHFVKKHEKSWIWSKLATFWKHYHVLTFRWTFQQKVAKTASFH